MTFFYDTVATPFGPFSIAVTDTGDVSATAFGGRAALEQRLGSRALARQTEAVREARKQVLAYCSGQLRRFTLPLSPQGTDFQQRVWAALAQIPFGEVRTYGEIALEIGQPKAARAVGRANATNPICLILPCHRVIGADGSLTGFAFGEALKGRLLAHEKPAPIGIRAA